MPDPTKRTGRMKPCLSCGKEFYVPPFFDARKKFCSKACYTSRYHDEDVKRERFWSKVHKGERCWIWVGTKHFRGYGACCKSYGDTRAHRVSWMYTNGPIPRGMGVLHKCDTPLCVNPAHLYLGDQKANRADQIARGRIGTRYQPVETLLRPHLSLRGQMSKRENRP